MGAAMAAARARSLSGDSSASLISRAIVFMYCWLWMFTLCVFMGLVLLRLDQQAEFEHTASDRDGGAMTCSP